MTSTQISSENKNFWSKISTSSTIQLSFIHSPPTDVPLKTSENQQMPINSSKNIELDKGKGEGSQPEGQAESGQENSAIKVGDMEPQKVGIEELHPSKEEEKSKIVLGVHIYGKLFQNSNKGYVWKTKWHLPPIMVKLKHEYYNILFRIPGIQKLLDKLQLQLYVIEPTKDQNKFQVVLGSIKGTTKKKILNGNCEFKNIKICSQTEGRKVQLLLISSFVNEENQKNREFFEIYISPEITVYNQSKFIQLEKSESFSVYFEMFDHQQLMRQSPKIRTDKIQTPQKIFQNYFFKKVPKIKNIFYLAIKFPEVVELYANSNYYFVDGELKSNFCQEVMESINTTEESQHAHMVSNHIDPETKLVLKVNCSANEINFFINKAFTKELCIVVGDDVVISPVFTKISDIEYLKKDYTDYCLNLQSELKNDPAGEGGLEGRSDDQESQSSDENSYNQDDDKKMRKKNKKKKDEKKYVPNRPVKVAIPDAIRSATRNTRGKKKDQSDDEESLYDEENMLMDEDEEDRPTKKTRSSAAVERRKRQNRIREKIDDKNDHRENMLHKAMNQQFSSVPPMVMPMGMMNPSQAMQYQAAGFPQMSSMKNGTAGSQPAMFVRQMTPPVVDKKSQSGTSGQDKDKNKSSSGLPAGITMPAGMAPYGMMQMMSGMPGMPTGMQGMPTMAGMPAGMAGVSMPSGMTGDMMMKGIFGGQMPANMGITMMGGPQGTVMAMMPQMGQSPQQPGQSNPPSSQKPTTSKSSEKSDEARSADMKKSMQMYSQYPMYAMTGNPMMAVMPNVSGQMNPSGQASQIGIPQMMAANSLSANLPQNGPFMLMSGGVPAGMVGGLPAGMMSGMQGQAQGINPRSPVLTSSSVFTQQKKKDGQHEDKKDDKKSTTMNANVYMGYPQMMDPNFIQQLQSMGAQQGFAMMNPSAMQGLGLEQLSNLPTQMASLQQQLSSMGGNIAMMMNPYGFQSGQPGVGGQPGNQGYPQMMGFSAGSMPQTGFGPQSPYGVLGVPQKTTNDQDGSKNKEFSQKQDEKNKQTSSSDKRPSSNPQQPQPVSGFQMPGGGYFIQAPPGMQMGSMPSMGSMGGMPMMTGSFTMPGGAQIPVSMMQRGDQSQSGTNPNWESQQAQAQAQALQSFLQMQGLANMQAMGGMPQGMQMPSFGQMGIPAQYMTTGQPSNAQMMQARNSMGQGQNYGMMGDKRKKDDK